jgi:hypothetical protein
MKRGWSLALVFCCLPVVGCGGALSVEEQAALATPPAPTAAAPSAPSHGPKADTMPSVGDNGTDGDHHDGLPCPGTGICPGVTTKQ